MFNRNEMLTKIFTKTPGIYLHISFQALAWAILFSIFIFVLLVKTMQVTVNQLPEEYPMYIDGKKLFSSAGNRDLLPRRAKSWRNTDINSTTETGYWQMRGKRNVVSRLPRAQMQ